MLPKSLPDGDASTATNDPPASALFSAERNLTIQTGFATGHPPASTCGGLAGSCRGVTSLLDSSTGFARKKIADAGAFREGIPLVTCWNSDIIILRIIFPSAAGPEGSLAYEERYTACFVSQ
jgi:hypothetical protein